MSESVTPEPALTTRRLFPIMGGPAVPWAFMAPHQERAKRNHDQTLERLAERGGLATGEALAVVTNRDCFKVIGENMNEIVTWKFYAAVATWMLRESVTSEPANIWKPVATAPKGRKVLLVKADGSMVLEDWGLYWVHNAPGFVLWTEPPSVTSEPPAPNEQMQEIRARVEPPVDCAATAGSTASDSGASSSLSSGPDEVLPLPEGCGYQGYEFGAGSYPDSICQGGRLYDADDCDNEGNLYEPEEHIPCPMCQRREAVAYWAERNRLSGSSASKALRDARSLVADIRQNRGAR